MPRILIDCAFPPFAGQREDIRFAINYVDCPPALRVFGPSPEKYSRLAPDL